MMRIVWRNWKEDYKKNKTLFWISVFEGLGTLSICLWSVILYPEQTALIVVSALAGATIMFTSSTRLERK